jgi:hypothetical protein
MQNKTKCKIYESNDLDCKFCNNHYSSIYYLAKHQAQCAIQINPIPPNSILNNSLPIAPINTLICNLNKMPNFIYPFGFEDMSYISDDDKLRVLTSKNPILEALKIIYSKPQNCNIYRPNSNKDNIKVLALSLSNNKTFDRERYVIQEFFANVSDDEISSNDFYEAFTYHIGTKEQNGFDKYNVNLEPADYYISVENIKYNDIKLKIIINAKNFLLRLLHSFKNKLYNYDELCIIENIEDCYNKFSNKLYLKDIVNFLETYFFDIIHKDNFKKYSIFIKINKNYKINYLKIVNKTINESRSYIRNRDYESLDEEFLKTDIWTKDESKTIEIAPTNQLNNLRIVELENTPRYKFFEEMKELEMKFFTEHGMTIGNLYKYRKILLDRAQTEINIIEAEYNDKNIKSKANIALINKTRQDMLNNLKDIRFIDPSRLVSGLDTIRFAKLTMMPKLAPECHINYVKNRTEEELYEPLF